MVRLGLLMVVCVDACVCVCVHGWGHELNWSELTDCPIAAAHHFCGLLQAQTADTLLLIPSLFELSLFAYWSVRG
jgi:hypothetical protein